MGCRAAKVHPVRVTLSGRGGWRCKRWCRVDSAWSPADKAARHVNWIDFCPPTTDRRSIGRSEEVGRDVNSRFKPRRGGVQRDACKDAVVRLRAAAVEKVTALRPDLLRPYKRRLLGKVARVQQQ